MPRNYFLHLAFSAFIPVVLWSQPAHGEATASLKAVAKNGVPITPTSALAVEPGDEITVELFLSGWGSPNFDPIANTGLVRTYHLALDGFNSVQSGGYGLILPEGWACLPILTLLPLCRGPMYDYPDSYFPCCVVDPSQVAWIDMSCPGFIFCGHLFIVAVSTGRLDVQWDAFIVENDGAPDSRCAGGPISGWPCQSNADCSPGICLPGGSFYTGTLNLVVGDDACGRFTFALKNSVDESFIGNPITPAERFLPALEPLILDAPECDTGACCDLCTGDCSDVVALVCNFPGSHFLGLETTCDATVCDPSNGVGGGKPPHCAIDARIPFPPNQPGNRQGFRSVDFSFYCPCGAGEDSPDDYTVQQIPESVPTTIDSVTINGNVATITFTSPIQPRRWTCVMHNASGTRRCVGYLPGDANGDRIAAPSDILDIIDNLNGVRNPPLADYQCDIDRSGLCAPPDILAEIDILNGLNLPCDLGPCNILPACPSMVGP